MNDRPQCGSSLQRGEIEMLIHRKTLIDDTKGSQEELDEKESIYNYETGEFVQQPIAVRTKHILMLSCSSKFYDMKQILI